MRKSAIPLVFFVVMCSLNILLAGCGANVDTQNNPSTQTGGSIASTSSATCHSCEAHNLAGTLSRVAPTLASYQSEPEQFPPTQNLIDSKIQASLIANNLETSMYSRNGNIITLTYPDSGKIIITIDSLARVKEVKELDPNNVPVERFAHVYGTYAAPLRATNLLGTGPSIIATVNYNSSQQIVSVTDNVNAKDNRVATPVSPYPVIFYSGASAPPVPALDGRPEDPSPAVQACWDGCTNAYNQAKAQADSSLAVATAAALAIYVAGLALCLASTIAYPVCAIGFYTAYVLSIAAATAIWLNSLQSAETDYINCMNNCDSTNGYDSDFWRKYRPNHPVAADPWNDNP